MALSPKGQPTIIGITYKDHQGQRVSSNRYEFLEGKLSFQSEACVHAIEKAPIKGFCMRRFRADLMTSGLLYKDLSEGDVLRIGDMTLKVTQIGKPCHAKECPAFNQEATCIMLHETMFGEILTGGWVTTGDGIEVS